MEILYAIQNYYVGIILLTIVFICMMYHRTNNHQHKED